MIGDDGKLRSTRDHKHCEYVVHLEICSRKMTEVSSCCRVQMMHISSLTIWRKIALAAASFSGDRRGDRLEIGGLLVKM